jgi:hypothetical protein
MLKSIIELFVKVFVEGLFGYFTNKKNDELSNQNTALQGALETVEDSHNQEAAAEGAAQNAASNIPNIVAPDGGLDFTDVNSKS